MGGGGLKSREGTAVGLSVSGEEAISPTGTTFFRPLTGPLPLLFHIKWVMQGPLLGSICAWYLKILFLSLFIEDNSNPLLLLGVGRGLEVVAVAMSSHGLAEVSGPWSTLIDFLRKRVLPKPLHTAQKEKHWKELYWGKRNSGNNDSFSYGTVSHILKKYLYALELNEFPFY